MTHTPERRSDYAARIEVSLIRYRLRTGQIGTAQAHSQLRALGVSTERILTLLDVSDGPVESMRPIRANVAIGGLFAWLTHARLWLLDLQTQALLHLVAWVSAGSQSLIKALSIYGLRVLAQRGELIRKLRSHHHIDIDAIIGTIGALGCVAMLIVVITDQMGSVSIAPLISMAWGKP